MLYKHFFPLYGLHSRVNFNATCPWNEEWCPWGIEVLDVYHRKTFVTKCFEEMSSFLSGLGRPLTCHRTSREVVILYVNQKEKSAHFSVLYEGDTLARACGNLWQDSNASPFSHAYSSVM
mmetsp:Transcript_46062/g.75155  ORF Transcript_46062/g.75155 Transcript_46062/m.75155 type:complete len:120 (-) Transcript_46062:12-371(-)